MSRIMLLLLLAPLGLQAQVSFERLLNADEEPHNWLTYSGTYASTRYSLLDRITPANVDELELKWVFQAQSLEKFEATPLVVDGIMYLTEAPNTAVALDAAGGRVFWDYRHNPSTLSRPCCGRVNRGLAMLGNTLFMATIDARLIAIDAINGQPVWTTAVADPGAGYAMTLAPLVVKDKVIVGVAGGEYGIRGFISAYDAETGEEAWKFYTIPGPGEPGHETWEGDTDAWQHGGASVWLTGSYDPDLDQTYWGIGNPGPDWNPAQRPGDNLYSDAVVALDPDTGELQWYFQFTPNDDYDYDAVQIPVLADIGLETFSSGRQMLWANRNGFFYVLDRTTGEFIRGEPFTEINWASGLSESGRPIETPQPPGATTYPGVQGATNWYSPSYSPRTGLFYLSAWENYGSVFWPEEQEYQEGVRFLGGVPVSPIPGGPNVPSLRGSRINNWTEAVGTGAVIAIDPATGEHRWKYEMTDVTTSGILTTATDVLFTGGREGYFHALDAVTGDLLWRTNLGGDIANGPISYAVGGAQYVAVAAGNGLFVFGLRD
ncbi:MAG: PQQ-dependent dehydrogenase, methanol/ethanol family [Proteobacteria bacterium]|nr:PQQ-dependent dehydrogenase, methanol/ethanol family [Pseudomonadota bacterium]MYJ95058.1 PQQ-dependent dehydrogenase, methanol/ethanol family [Pseudomonadota bacterium]